MPALLLALVLFGSLPFTSSAAPPAAPLLPSPGAVVAWGSNASGQLNVPAGLDDAVAVATGEEHGLALKSDGTVVGWGFNSNGQATPPAGLSNVLAISADGFYSLALRALSRLANRDQCKNGGWQTFTEPTYAPVPLQAHIRVRSRSRTRTKRNGADGCSCECRDGT